MRLIILLFLFFSLVNTLFAGTTGKIAGTIVDSETKEPLAGVNVYLEGTHFGAATDIEGNYYIINVPAGTYTLVVSYIGYSEKKIQGIKVNIDLTSTINIDMVEESLFSSTIIWRVR